MRIAKYFIAATLLISGLTTRVKAQSDVELTAVLFNVCSFEYQGGVADITFDITYLTNLIAAKNPDIVGLNELETLTSRMGSEKVTEMAERLGMYPYFCYSYDKESGYYGNGFLSKYPIISAQSIQLPYLASVYEENYDEWGADQRSVMYADILVPTDANPEGVVVRCALAHFDHKQTEYYKGLYVATKAIDFFYDEDVPSIFFGDLNTTSGYGSTTSSTSESNAYLAKYMYCHIVNWVDYFWGSISDWTSSNTSIISNGGYSDHSGISIDFKLVQ